MSVRGVAQVKQLTIRYCDFSGSSHGVRDYIRTGLINLAKQYPHINFHASLSRKSNPSVSGLFIDDSTEQLSLANIPGDKIEKELIKLISKAPHPPLKRWSRAKTTNPSIQGYWSPLLNYQPPKERIIQPGEFAARLKEVDNDYTDLKERLIALGLSRRSMRRFFMTDEQRRKLKTEERAYRDIDQIGEFRDLYGIDLVSPYDPEKKPEEFKKWEDELYAKLRVLQARLKQEAKDEKKEKQGIKERLRKEKQEQASRDNLIVKAKYKWNHIRPDVLYGEFPIKNLDGITNAKKPLDFAVRPNPKYQELLEAKKKLGQSLSAASSSSSSSSSSISSSSSTASSTDASSAASSSASIADSSSNNNNKQ